MAMICSVVANTAPFLQKKRAFRPDDFMPNRQRVEPQPQEVLRTKIKAIAHAMKGQD